jgi:PAS domain S-box-containing protein
VVGKSMGLIRRLGGGALAWYVRLVLLGGIAALVVGFGTTSFGSPLAMLGFFAAMSVAQVMPIPLRRGSEMETVAFEEAIVLPMVLVLPAAGALLVTVAAMLVWQLIVRQPLAKLGFNVGQMLLSVGAACAVTAAIAGSAPGEGDRAVGAALVGALAMLAVNQVLVAGVFALATGSPYVCTLVEDIDLKCSLWIVNASFGLLLIPVIFDRPVFLLGALAMFSFVHASSRAYLRGIHSDDAIRELRDATEGLGADTAIEHIAERIARIACQLHGASGAEVRLDGRRSADADGTEDSGIRVETGIRGRLCAVLQLEDGGKRLGELRVWRDHGQVRRSSAQQRRDQAMLELLARQGAAALSKAAHAQDASRQRTVMARVFEHSLQGLAVLADDGKVIAWNPAMERLTGYDAPQMLGRSVAVVSADLAHLPDMSSAGVVDARMVAADGTALWVRAAFAPIVEHEDSRGTRGHAWVVALHDTTREREVERLKSDFVATVSHELRTPLTTIRGFIETLRREDLAIDEAQQATFLDIMRAEARRLDRLINDLLDSSAIEAGGSPRVRVVPTDLAELVRGAVDSFRAAYPDVEVRCAHDSSATLLAHVDPDRLRQVLHNLLENARRHGAADAPILVRVGRGDGIRATVSVRDHGAGIAPEDQSHIFDRFFVARDSVTRSGGGAGLGLYISHRLMQAMDGAIHVDSVPGAGATFTLRVPLSAPVRRRRFAAKGRPDLARAVDAAAVR